MYRVYFRIKDLSPVLEHEMRQNFRGKTFYPKTNVLCSRITLYITDRVRSDSSSLGVCEKVMIFPSEAFMRTEKEKRMRQLIGTEGKKEGRKKDEFWVQPGRQAKKGFLFSVVGWQGLIRPPLLPTLSPSFRTSSHGYKSPAPKVTVSLQLERASLSCFPCGLQIHCLSTSGWTIV